MIRRRLVRVHLRDDGHPSLEGLLSPIPAGCRDGTYILELVKVIETDSSYTLEGSRVRIPRERVAFIQELK